MCAVLRGLGDSKNPLYFVMIATCVNVVLDIVLIGRYGMGTKGAAVATVISEAVSFSVIASLHGERPRFSISGGRPLRLRVDKGKADSACWIAVRRADGGCEPVVPDRNGDAERLWRCGCRRLGHWA